MAGAERGEGDAVALEKKAYRPSFCSREPVLERERSAGAHKASRSKTFTKCRPLLERLGERVLYRFEQRRRFLGFEGREMVGFIDMPSKMRFLRVEEKNYGNYNLP